MTFPEKRVKEATCCLLGGRVMRFPAKTSASRTCAGAARLQKGSLGKKNDTVSFFSLFSLIPSSSPFCRCSVKLSREGKIGRGRNDRVGGHRGRFRHGYRSKSSTRFVEGGGRQKVQPVASKSNSLISSGSRER